MTKPQLFVPARRVPLVAACAYLGLAGVSLACGSSDEDEPSESEVGALEGAAPVTSVPSRREPSNAPDEAATAAGDRTPSEEAPTSADDEPAASPDAPAGTEALDARDEPAQTFEACTASTYGCDYVYVTVKQTSPARCVQLNIDNCGSYSRQGLTNADTPLSWRLASGSIGTDPSTCELGVFYPASASVLDASGSIDWSDAERPPTDLIIDLTLTPSSLADDPSSIHVATSAPLNPRPCDD